MAPVRTFLTVSNPEPKLIKQEPKPILISTKKLWTAGITLCWQHNSMMEPLFSPSKYSSKLLQESEHFANNHTIRLADESHGSVNSFMGKRYNVDLADCCGARGACSIARCRMVLRARECVRVQNPPHPSNPSLPPCHSSFLPTPLSLQSSSSFRLPYHSNPPLPSFLHYNLGGCRRRGAGLDLDHSAAASSGTTRWGGPCEGGRPRGWPRLSRAPARTPQTPNVLSAGAGAGGGDSGWPRTDGTGCVVLGGEGL